MLSSCKSLIVLLFLIIPRWSSVHPNEVFLHQLTVYSTVELLNSRERKIDLAVVNEMATFISSTMV